jgi:hypothetical protein
LSTELIITFCVLALEVGLLIFLYVQSRKPPVPGRVRVFPFTLGIVVMVVLIFLTGAHAISLLTGVQVQPRRPKGMR